MAELELDAWNVGDPDSVGMADRDTCAGSVKHLHFASTAERDAGVGSAGIYKYKNHS